MAVAEASQWVDETMPKVPCNVGRVWNMLPVSRPAPAAVQERFRCGACPSGHARDPIAPAHRPVPVRSGDCYQNVNTLRV
ncbi:hypothetical protein GCM10017566_10520 [Amycolatopsis bartoniae]|uniref:Uncharacterized protein n=1 Tax=Amycolatopsis bartoniae TaxID=941986 RepID=A0A8H9IVR7_9PSEU|nr:hypothetical protein GCM10017566_10520 [Amycolatopsis bartoniae]